jgi:hypothetical protein
MVESEATRVASRLHLLNRKTGNWAAYLEHLGVPQSVPYRVRPYAPLKDLAAPARLLPCGLGFEVSA